MCRKKKIKCDGKLPACTHCINYKTDCVFTQVEKKRSPPKGYARTLLRPRGCLLCLTCIPQRQIHREPREQAGSHGEPPEAIR